MQSNKEKNKTAIVINYISDGIPSLKFTKIQTNIKNRNTTL